MKGTDLQNARYIDGRCVDCGDQPHSAGRPRCSTCHQTHTHQPTSPDAKN